MTETAATIFQFKKMLKNFEACMGKASAFADSKKFETQVLVDARLAPDMFPLVKQIQSMCDVAKFCAAYLSGKTPPKHEDNEKTWAECRERITKVLNYLEEFKASDFDNALKMQVKPGWAKGQWMSGSDYIQEIAIPNFYFHVMAGYAILRHNGVDIGKMDYLGDVNLQGTPTT